jgi:hypothetical protein
MTIPTDLHVLAFIGLFIATMFYLVAGVKNVLALLDRSKPRPPLHEQYATKSEIEHHSIWDGSEHQVLHGRVDRLKSATVSKEIWERQAAELDHWRGEVTAKLDELLQRTAKLAGYNGGDK